MTCGCTKSVSTPVQIPVVIRSGMCATCQYLPADGGVKGPCGLTIGGRPLQQMIQDPLAKCYRWPDLAGIVTWRGRKWFGVPDPLRWVFLFRWGRQPRREGCGCVVSWKMSKWGRWLDPWLSISEELRGRAAAAIQGWKAMKRLISQQGATHGHSGVVQSVTR